MKFSFCSIGFRRTDAPLTTIIPMLAEVGYDGVEIWANHLRGDGSDIDTVAACLEEHKLSVPMVSPYFNVTGGEDKWEATLRAATVHCRYAAALKAPLIRTFTGFLGSDEVDKELWATAAGRLARLCDLAAGYDLELALETHPKTLVDTVPSIERLMSDVGRANLVLNLDIYHLWERHGDPMWIWDRLGPYVRHVHAKNAVIPPGNGDDYPLFHDKQGRQEINGVTYLADGNMDYLPFMRALAEEFEGWLSIEWFGPDPINAAAHELAWAKRLIGATDAEMTFT